MTETLPVGKLRQNPADYLRAVAGGARFVITSHRRPIADLVPHGETGGITGPELMRRLRKVHGDDTWLDQLRSDRQAVTGQDPWE